MIRDGVYKVYFESVQDDGEVERELAGEYVLKAGKIIHTTGIASSVLELGPLSNKMIHRMEFSLNNGYYVTVKEG